MRPPRVVLVASYLAFACAGMFFTFWGPNSGLRELLDWGFYLWNGFLILGGVIGATGAWTGKFRIEIIATPFLTSALAVYGGYTLAQIETSRSPGVIAGLGSVFVGCSLLFLGKGLAIWIHKIRVANQVERRTGDAV